MKEFIREIADNALTFGAKYVFLSPMPEDRILAESLDEAKSIYLRGLSLKAGGLGSSKAYLGNLEFLRKICGMEQISGADGRIELVHTEAAEDTVVKDLIFKGPRLSAQYRATDARVATATTTMPKTYPKDFPVTATISKANAKELRDAVTLQSTALAKKPEECFVHVGVNRGVLTARFPYHDTGIELGLGHVEAADIETPFASEILIRVLDTATKASNECTFSLSPMACRIQWKTDEVEFVALLPKSIIAVRA